MDDDDFLLMDPGPVQLTTAVREAAARPMVSHRSPTFEAVHRDCQRGVAAAFGTERDPIVINGNGWIGIETAMAGVLNGDDEVLAIQTGKFGRQNGDVAERYAERVDRLRGEWGSSVDLDAVEARLAEGVDAVTMTHCETSTGVVNPVSEVAALADEYGALSFVDGVSSVGGERFAFDEWGVDVAVTASQKGLGGPPGLSAVVLSERARDRVDGEGAPFSLDLSTYLTEAETNQTPSTAPVPAYYSLAEALRSLPEEGAEARVERHRRLAGALRDGARALGLEAYAEPEGRSKLSNTIQVLDLPDGIGEDAVVEGLAERNVSVRGGLGRLQGDVVRIATMGRTDADDVLRTLDALGATLAEIESTAVDPAAGRTAARETL